MVGNGRQQGHQRRDGRSRSGRKEQKRTLEGWQLSERMTPLITHLYSALNNQKDSGFWLPFTGVVKSSYSSCLSHRKIKS